MRVVLLASALWVVSCASTAPREPAPPVEIIRVDPQAAMRLKLRIDGLSTFAAVRR